MATLRTHDLTKSYGGRTVVRGVNLEVASGEVVGLLGPERRRQDDDVLHDGRPDRARFGPRRARRHRRHRRPDVHPRAQGHRLPAAGAVDLPRPDRRAEHPRDSRDDAASTRAARRARLRELLAELNLTPLAQAPAYTLSGGERRRAEITRALVISPKFILLDEPFAGIDPIAVTDIQKIIFHLKDRGIGVLITDHNVRETLRITDRAYIVHDGVIFKSGTPDSLAADEEVRRIYLGTEFRLD